MEAQVDTLCLLAQPKEGQQQFKNKKQPELTENQIIWKSDNQRNKEETFIQTSRRAETSRQGGEDSPQGGSWWTGQGGGWWSGQPHICMWVNQEEQLWSETDHTTQGSSVGK